MPIKWVVVSDGSTDGTDDIVRIYAANHLWIELIRMPERPERSFAGKVLAFNSGWERVKRLPWEIIGNLDADVSFGNDHFEFLLAKFAGNPRLGVGGTPFTEGHGTYDFRFSSLEHVSGICQLFRRECYESIGGYNPIKHGGVYLVAVITARMKGWQTRTFPERVCFHHRKMGSGTNATFVLHFDWGQRDYRLGSHPLWELFRCLYKAGKRPYILGGLLYLFGYLYALVTMRQRDVSDEFAAFRAKEQMFRLKNLFNSRINLGADSPQS